MKLFIITPHYRNMEPEYQSSVHQAIPAWRALGQGLEVIQTETNLVPFARSDSAELAVQKYGADKILFIDSDMEFTANDIGLLLDANVPIIGGLYVSKYYPVRCHVYEYHDPVRFIFKEMGNFPKNKPFKCDGIGAGFLLIDKSVIKHMLQEDVVRKFGRPFNLYQKENGYQLGEDFSFCLRAKALGYDIWCEPRVNLSHIGMKKYSILDYEISRAMYYCNDIQGWMNLEELNWLYNTAKSMGSIIELGAWKGRSTHALLSGCLGRVTVVDHFQGSTGEKEGPHKEAKDEDIQGQFLHNVEKFKNMSLYNSHLKDALIHLKPVDMVFIDGSHIYEEVKEDIIALEPYAKKILCGHDFNWSDVNQAVEDVLGLQNIEIYQSIWIHRRRK